MRVRADIAVVFHGRKANSCPAYSVWTDHANFISLAYSGTGALKTDFTRTGKRTRKGLFEDGYNSVMRYLKNNFLDGARQVRNTVHPSCSGMLNIRSSKDAFDLMTGAWFPRRGWNPATLVIDSRPLIIRAVCILHTEPVVSC